MRRWFLIILLLVYPFQATLAMADGCCVATPGGVTHHSAGGEAGALAAEPVFLLDDAAPALADPHCAACMFGQLSGVPSYAAAMPAAAGHAPAIAFAIPLLASVPKSRPERPNWPAAAR